LTLAVALLDVHKYGGSIMDRNAILGVSRSILEKELAKFFLVSFEYQKKTGSSAMMPSCIVDSVWHKLLKQPKQLRLIVSASLGENVEVLHLENKGEGTLHWVAIYEEKFGQLPVVWFTKPDGSVDQQALDHYQRTGEVRLAWDCVPAIKPLKIAA